MGHAPCPFCHAPDTLGHRLACPIYYDTHDPPPRTKQAIAAWRDVVADLRGRDETLLGWWCIAHQALLATLPTERGWHLVAYEDVVRDPRSILCGLENSWQVRFPERVHLQMRQPSATTMDGTALEDPLVQLGKWQDSFSDAKLHRYQTILESFEISAYDVHSSLPVTLERDFHGQ